MREGREGERKQERTRTRDVRKRLLGLVAQNVKVLEKDYNEKFRNIMGILQ